MSDLLSHAQEPLHKEQKRLDAIKCHPFACAGSGCSQKAHRSNRMFKGLCLATALVALVGCASTSANLQRETARFIGGNVSPEQVTILDVNRSITSVKWKAAA